MTPQDEAMVERERAIAAFLKDRDLALGESDEATDEERLESARCILALLPEPRAAIEAISAGGGEPDWDDLRGVAPDATGGMSSEAFIRAQRDAFDAAPSPPETREADIRADEREAAIAEYTSQIDIALREYDENLRFGDDAQGPEWFIEKGLDRAAAAIRARGQS